MDISTSYTNCQLQNWYQGQIRVCLHLTLLTLILLATCSVSAQKNDNKFSLLAHTGVSGTQVQGDGLGGFDKLGLMLGLGVEMGLSDKSQLGFELNFVQKGSKKNPNPENGDYEKYKMSLLYIQVPLYFHYHITEKISALAGPSIGFLVSSKEEDLDGSYTPNPDFNPIDFSAIAGAQYKFSDRILAEVRFDQSIVPIRFKDSGSSRWMNGKQFNTALGLYICYTIN